MKTYRERMFNRYITYSSEKNELLESKLFNLNLEMNSLIDNYQWIEHDISGGKYPLKFHEDKREIKYIVLHYTATFSNPNNGLSKILPKIWNREWNNNPTYEASADFGVDEDIITQYNPDLEHYHCFSTNNDADKISIEMCNTYNSLGTTQMRHEIKANAEQWSFSEKVLENTKKLIIELYRKFGELEIITHFDVPNARGKHKACPGIWGWNTLEKYDKDGKPCGMNDTSELEKFKKEVKTLWEEVKNK